jgi:5-methyltetrahydropteroyltriglutamate--homocysteine methyltransferase
MLVRCRHKCPLDTQALDIRFQGKFQDAWRGHRDQQRVGPMCSHGDLHVDEDLAGRAWYHYPLRWAGFEGDHLQPEETTVLLHYPPGTLLNEIYGWRWPHVVDKIEHRALDYPKLWRLAGGRASRSSSALCCR